MPSYTKNVNIFSILCSYWTLKLFKRSLGKKPTRTVLQRSCLFLCLCFFSRHVHKQFRTGKNLKHLKLSRWRQIMTNSYWWEFCTLNYTLSKAICPEVFELRGGATLCCCTHIYIMLFFGQLGQTVILEVALAPKNLLVVFWKALVNW